MEPGQVHGLPSRSLTLIVAFDEPIDVVRMPDPARRPASFWSMLGGLHTSPATVRSSGTATWHRSRDHAGRRLCLVRHPARRHRIRDRRTRRPRSRAWPAHCPTGSTRTSDGTLGSMCSTNCSPPPSAHASRFLPRSHPRGSSSPNPTAHARSDHWPIKSGRAPGSSPSSSGTCSESRRNRRPESCGSNEHRSCCAPVPTSRSHASRRVAAMPTSPTWHASGEVLRPRVRRTGDGKSADSSKTSRSQRGHTRRHGD